MRQLPKPFALLVAALAALMLTLSACAGDQNRYRASGQEATFPLEVASANGPVRIEQKPERVVSLSPTATESLFAIGAGDQVVAVDDQSNFPAEAPTSNLSGFTPNAEAIAGERPDLVVVSNDMNGIVDALGRLDIPTLVQPAATSLDDVYTQIEALGRATGHADRASDIAWSMRRDIDTLFSEKAKASEGKRYYHEVDDTLYSVTSKTFIGRIYAGFGLQNIADAADKSGAGYPQLSAEYIVTAQPDFIFLADTKCCGQSLATVSARPGWSTIPAVRSGNVIALDDDIASRWGPRTVDLVRSIGDAVGTPAA